VTLTATDALSRVQTIQYRPDRGAITTFTSPISVATGGTHTLTYYSTGVAGNLESTRTFERAHRPDGVGAGCTIRCRSCLPTTPASPTATHAAVWVDDHDPDDDHIGNAPDGHAQVQSYSITDAAGNVSSLTVKERATQGALQSRELTLQSKSAPPIDLPRNFTAIWKAAPPGFRWGCAGRHVSPQPLATD
jgi:hypothetical protein